MKKFLFFMIGLLCLCSCSKNDTGSENEDSSNSVCLCDRFYEEYLTNKKYADRKEELLVPHLDNYNQKCVVKYRGRVDIVKRFLDDVCNDLKSRYGNLSKDKVEVDGGQNHVFELIFVCHHPFRTKNNKYYYNYRSVYNYVVDSVYLPRLERENHPTHSGTGKSSNGMKRIIRRELL